MNGRYFLWLVPEEPYFGNFLSIISDLSKMLEGVSFLPHVTFCTSESQDIFEIELPVIPVQFKKIVHSEIFFQSIYLNLESKELNNYRSQVINDYKVPLQPHLSLFYGHLTTQQRVDICSTLQIDTTKKCLLTKKVLVYGSAIPSQGYTDVRSWQIIKTEVLT